MLNTNTIRSLFKPKISKIKKLSYYLIWCHQGPYKSALVAARCDVLIVKLETFSIQNVSFYGRNRPVPQQKSSSTAAPHYSSSTAAPQQKSRNRKQFTTLLFYCGSSIATPQQKHQSEFRPNRSAFIRCRAIIQRDNTYQKIEKNN